MKNMTYQDRRCEKELEKSRLEEGSPRSSLELSLSQRPTLSQEEVTNEQEIRPQMSHKAQKDILEKSKISPMNQ